MDEKWEALREADLRLADARDQHYRDLREADQRALQLLQESNREHFAQLNENAKRTIEERSHFVSVETFEPFRKQVLEFMARASGSSSGTGQTVAWLVAGLSIAVAIVTVIVLIIGG